MRERSRAHYAARLPAALLIACAGLLIAAVSWKRVQPTPLAGRLPDAERPECPHDSVTWRDTLGVPHSYAQIPLSGEISSIPEFHDCQRFIRRDGSYDSLYAIYAAFRLESLPCGLSCGGQMGAVAIPAATILSYGGTYDYLGIRTGFNCLILWDPPNWKAAIIPQYANEDCRSKQTVNPLPTYAKQLPVNVLQPQSVPPFREREYPPVARWDWDPLTAQQYIGIRCGLAWCEVGNSSPAEAPGSGPMYPPPLPFDPVPGFVASSATTKSVALVKGWYDAQLLAARVTSSPAGALKVRPSQILGFIVPNPVLGDLQLAQFQSQWVHVAWAVVPGGDYPSKLSYRKGRNKISLCYGTSRSCGILILPRCPVRITELQQAWWAKTQFPDRTVRFNCVTWRSYPKEIDVPGTVRWRWQAEDETNWIKCPSGCCEVRP